MKVLLINGSPHAKGNTAIALVEYENKACCKMTPFRSMPCRYITHIQNI